ncbi:MAG: hypothetical protein WC076_12115 [Terrimicrobiaceae bacterium]|jgi:uncharacterized membrane protein YccC|nr:hypothetical protein [Terrimicrobiaceae bacterium]
MKRWMIAAASLAVLAGCDSPSRTVDAARKQLSAFQAAPDAEKQATVERSLAKLDAQVEELEKKGDRVQADLFRRQALGLRTDFQAAKMARALHDASKAIQGIGEAFKDAGKSFSETLKNSDSNQP